MKLYLALFLFALLSAALYSRDITTLSGITYRNATVFDSNAGELIISYQDKDKPELTIMKPVPFTDLPDNIRKEFKYDPVKAELFEKARKEGNRKKAEKMKGENVISPVVLDIPEGIASVNNSPIGGNVAPGEKNGAEEANAMKREAMDSGRAPGEKEGAAESRAMRKEAFGNPNIPGE